MSTNLYFSIIYIMFLLTFMNGFELSSKKSWTFEMKSVKTKSSNTDLYNMDYKVERVSRGVYALSGTLNINMDIVEGDENELEMKIFRSANGNGNEYQSLPLQIERTHWYVALNTYYKDILMETFKDCSDLPYFEDEFVPPLEKKIYTVTKCSISQKGLPNHLQEGLYKFLLIGYGAVEWELELIIEVMPNL